MALKGEGMAGRKIMTLYCFKEENRRVRMALKEGGKAKREGRSMIFSSS